VEPLKYKEINKTVKSELYLSEKCGEIKLLPEKHEGKSDDRNRKEKSSWESSDVPIIRSELGSKKN